MPEMYFVTTAIEGGRQKVLDTAEALVAQLRTRIKELENPSVEAETADDPC